GINTYAYAGGTPLMLTDPLGLEGVGPWNNGSMDNVAGGIDPEGVVDFCAGVGDALSFGLTRDIRNSIGIDGGVDETSRAYSVGGASTFAAGGARLAYAGGARL